MVLPLQKRVLMSICASSLLTAPSFAKSTDDNIWGKVATGCAVVAGIASIGALIGWACSKTDEQVASEGFGVLNEASRARLDHGFYNICANVGYGINSMYLEALEQEVLYPIALRAWEHNTSMRDYISNLSDQLSTLKSWLYTVEDRISSLERNHDTYGSIYARLRALSRDMSEEINALDGYYNLLYKHRAFFNLYAYEAKLYKYYNREMEIGRVYTHDVYLFERYILQAVGTHSLRKDFPLLAYDSDLNAHIAQLADYISALPYYYPGRTVTATQLLDYLKYMRGVVEASHAFKEEKRAQREAEERRVRFEYERAARERETTAREMQAAAEWARVREERERKRILQNQQPPTVIIVQS